MENNDSKKLVVDCDVVVKKVNDRNGNNEYDRKTLAKDIGKSEQTLSNWKRREVPGIVQNLLKMADIGDCDIKDFIKEENV